MSVKSNPGTGVQAFSSNIAETTASEDTVLSMKEWIRRHDPASVFLESDRQVVTYGEALERVEAIPTGKVEVLRPQLESESILTLLAAASSGSALLLGPEREAPVLTRQPGTAFVLLTSGTTGRPKGVRLTWQNWEAASGASAEHLGHGADDTWLLAMPLHHVAGLGIVIRSAFVGGRVRVLARFDAAMFARELHRGVTVASVVPTMLERVLAEDAGPYRGLRAVLVGGGRIPDGLLERAGTAGLPVLPTYGMTETCGQVATLRPGSSVERKAHPLPGVEVSITEGGRIALRGGQVFAGYLGEPDRAASEWFVTSDLGRLDEDGALRVLGRADDLIITGGENVDPREVEAVVASHRDSGSVMVVALLEPEWGQIVGCLYTGEAVPAELEAHARAGLPSHAVPRRWRRVPSIPVSALGKPDRVAGQGLFS